MDRVPFSCCSTFSPRPCIQQRLADGSAHFNYDQQSRELNLWRRGCHQALMEHYTTIMQSVGLIVLLIWLFEVLRLPAGGSDGVGTITMRASLITIALIDWPTN